jgi:arginyl-tRNA synthetase
MSKAKIKSVLVKALTKLGIEESKFSVDIPSHRKFGDYASNIAISTGRKLQRNPLDVANELVANVDKNNFLKVEVAKPGFINFTLSDKYLQNNVEEIHKRDHDYGKGGTGKGERVLLEFVSANPTGPLHIGHGRWAVIGDAIARLLNATGYKVESEFYVNNVGNQVQKLVESVNALREGRPIPEGGYGGAYVKEVKGKTPGEMLTYLLDQQKQTLSNLGVNFTNWYYESDLHGKNKVIMAVQKLHDLRVTFEEGGAIWFKSEELGDDKNRVLIREDGNPTYFAADIAYHLDKFNRGYDHLIDIWGTDHHGYVKRLRAGLRILGLPVDKFEIIIGQLVTLYREKEPVRMSKRTGEMITLQEVIDEIGADATRFFFSATDVNSHLDFDLELAKKKSQDNPVYYVQYAHARICSILKKSDMPMYKSEPAVNLTNLTHPAERDLMLKLLSWADVVEEAARMRHPHKITTFAKELATTFHSFYEKCKVLGNPARLYLVDATRITLRNVLELLGISAPESM